MQHVFRDGVWWPRLTPAHTDRPALKQATAKLSDTPPNTPQHTQSETEFELNHRDVSSEITPCGSPIIFDDVFDTNSLSSDDSSIHAETSQSYSPNQAKIASKSVSKNSKSCINVIDCANYFSGINSPKKKATCEDKHLFIKPQFTAWCF